MVLTQSTTFIIGWIATLLGYVMEFIFRVLSSFGIENIGLCIIFFTLFVRLLLLPLTLKQQKFSKISQVMQPEINKIQKKYRNKKDQASMQRQNEEIQEVYAKYGTSPTGGCLQLIIQMPVFFALYQVIRKIPAYIPQVKVDYNKIVEAISTNSGYIDNVNKIIKGIGSSYVKELPSSATPDQVIDQMSFFNESAWDKLASAFPQAGNIIESASHHIISMNDFVFGINISQTPGWHPSIYWLIPLFAGLFQFLSAKTMQSPQMNDNSQAASMNKSMTYMMPLMSVYFCLIMPAGLGIYWVASALIQFITQVVINKYMENIDMDKLIAKNQEKAKKKKAKGKKSIMERIMNTSAKAEAAKEDINNNTNKMDSITAIANMKTKNIVTPSGNDNDVNNIDENKLGDITKGAYGVSIYDKKHNTKGGK